MSRTKDESQLFQALDELCVEMSERTGQPWGYNKEVWAKALRRPPTNIAEMVDEQHRQMLRDFNKSPIQPMAHENVIKLNQHIFGDGDGTFPENLIKRFKEESWTCENHLTPVPDIPEGEACPVCQRTKDA